MAFAALFIAFIVQASAVTIRYEGYSQSAVIKIGVAFQSTTIGSAISLVEDGSNTPVSLAGTQVAKWNRSTQDWTTSTYDFGAWSSNLSIEAGDALFVTIPVNGVDLLFTGTYYSGSKSITVKPGLNLLAANVTDDLSDTGISLPSMAIRSRRLPAPTFRTVPDRPLLSTTFSDGTQPSQP